jgi:ribosomal-protein-alanine N-acetyltransferase
MSTNLVLPPTLEFEGACLRAMRVSDTEAILGYLSDPAVTERTSFPEITRELVDGMIERATARWAAGDLSKWAIVRKADDRVVGTCGFNDWSGTHGWAEIAYDLAREEWGKGLMIQAVSAVIGWTFRHTEVQRIQAYVRVDNARSEKLLDRLGFVREGRLRQFRVCRGQPYDYGIFGLLRSEWVEPRYEKTPGELPGVREIDELERM